MYITSDGAEEVVLGEHHTGSGQDTFAPHSVDSTDVIKTGLLYTKTPDTIKKGKEGRERLLTFLDKVEANIAKEIQERKQDITALRNQMAKNMEANQQARAKMKKFLLAEMAKNAKKAKDDLAAAMRKTQKQFAEAAALENKRNKETRKRARKTREIMRKNKKEARKELADATHAQQRALATLRQETNAKIKKTNKHIAANAAHIKENAKKARDALNKAMDEFDHKMANVEEEARKGRSKLAAQAAAQDAKFRTYANNEIKAVAMKTAKEFRDVRKKMAEDRANADAALAHTTSQMNAALHAATALQDKRFQQTVSDIAAAKKEANDRVEKFRTSFKADILKLSGTVEKQQKELNSHVDQLSATVTNNKAAQAKINREVDAELKRMVKVGQDRYDEHIKKDQELHQLMAKNKESTNKEMDDMAEKFHAAIDKIKDQMKKDRAHHERQLSKATGNLFKTLADNKKAQEAVNKQLTAATRRVKLDADQALQDAKADFTERTGALSQRVDNLEKKHNGKVLKLTGIVRDNAVKDAEGRAELKKLSDWNKSQVEAAIKDAVHKGEQRALQIEKKMDKINKDNRAELNQRITTEIADLTKHIHGEITDLALDNKEARAQMKREIIFAIDSAKEVASKNLKDCVAWAEGEFSKLHNRLAGEEKLGAEERKKLKEQIEEDKKTAKNALADAVAQENKVLIAYRQEMCEEAGVLGGVIKNGKPVITENKNCGGGKLNKKLNGQYELMMRNAEAVSKEMDANKQALISSLENARQAADAQLSAASQASVAAYDGVIKAVEEGIEEATKKSDERFVEVYKEMAKNAEEVSNNLKTSVANLNKDIAKHAAAQDLRFSKTVDDIEAFRKEAAGDVADAKKMMLASMADAYAELKRVETRIVGEITTVTGLMVSHKAEQAIVNKKVKAQVEALFKKSDINFSEDKRARGVLKKIMDDNKAAAAEETLALKNEAFAALKETRSQQNAHLSGFKKDLTEATEKVYKKLADDKAAQEQAISNLHGELNTAKATTAAALAEAQKVFGSRVTTLTNAITANAKAYQEALSQATGVTMDWKSASTADRAAIRLLRDGMVADLNKDIVKAIQIGEAKIRAVEEEANLNINREKKALLSTIATSVENMADNVFATVQENRHKIADNYLSLKAYAGAAKDMITDYLQKGKGRNLSSVGDLLNSLAQIADVHTAPGEGEGYGSEEIPLIFSGKKVKVDGSISKINGLVNEYIKEVGMVKDRWPMGLGKYLIAKLEIAMQNEGALEVDKVEGRSGNFVFINAHSVGLSSKLSDFMALAVKMHVFEQALSGLTAKLPSTKTAAHKHLWAPAPEWQGD